MKYTKEQTERKTKAYVKEKLLRQKDRDKKRYKKDKAGQRSI